tara:strand:- start:218 stop:688 length:471 start_codon:yes stop_codon:yes gene_type:complete
MPRSNVALTEDLNAQKALVETLEKQVASLKPVGNTLTGTFWLPRSLNETARNSDGEEFPVIKWSTTEGGAKKVTFPAQLSYIDKRSGEKFYSKSMSFTCSDNGVKLASDIAKFIEADTRLCDFTAFPRFYLTNNQEKGEQWIITSITARPRPEASA